MKVFRYENQMVMRFNVMNRFFDLGHRSSYGSGPRRGCVERPTAKGSLVCLSQWECAVLEELRNNFVTGLIVVLIDLHAVFLDKGLQQLIHQFHNDGITVNFKRPVFFYGIQGVMTDIAGHYS